MAANPGRIGLSRLFRNAAVSFFLALAAMIIEVIPMADLDNVFIPVVIGALAQFFQGCI